MWTIYDELRFLSNPGLKLRFFMVDVPLSSSYIFGHASVSGHAMQQIHLKHHETEWVSQPPYSYYMDIYICVWYDAYVPNCHSDELGYTLLESNIGRENQPFIDYCPMKT